ncbi:hypothetical protein MtrunA17_Chr7g0255171 [Medicago truncatula]|uniref:Transmembrane protein n=1 Tax=Medicago truncatula TaxID=3880 RepID=A0A396H558_MEDTR|nr:hypothetical protein MtrunA17_Chr7g0255171 [Medicago truncatula]
MSTKHNHLASSPSSSVAASVETSNLKNRRLYQVWKGNNVHFFFFLLLFFSPLFLLTIFGIYAFL